MSIKSDSVDEVLVVETPERVALHFPLASLGNRFLACAIDHLLQGLVIAVILILGYHLNATMHALGLRFRDSRTLGGLELLGELNVWLTGLGILLLFAILFGYFILFETIWSGQTPGKRLLHLRVISADGRPVTFFAVMTRNMIRLADMIVPPFYSVGLLAVFASRHSQRLGDFVAGTVVIKESPGTAPTFDEIFIGALSDPARRRLVPPVNFKGEVGLVTPAEILAVEIFLRRRDQLPESPRQWLAWRVAAPLLERLRPEYDPQHFSYEGFLEELLEKWEERGNIGR